MCESSQLAKFNLGFSLNEQISLLNHNSSELNSFDFQVLQHKQQENTLFE